MDMSAAVEEVHSSLKRQFRGDLMRPHENGYDLARGIWNGMVARKPGLIARCAGHSLAGFSTCEGGLVIDLFKMRQVTVDREARRGRLAGGCLLGSVDTATQKKGLAFPAGVVSHTGASGLILGGGFGWLTRLHGLSSDNVQGFTMVTADSSVVRADSKENPDLYWALRGGGGNFGVVTEFEVKLYPVSSVLLGEAFCLGDDIPRIVRRWRDFMPEAPDNLRWTLSLRF